MAGVSFLHQFQRLRTASWLNPEQVDSNSEGLRYLNANSDIFITRQYQSIADGLIPCQINQISHNQGIHTLLFAFAVYRPEAEFGIWRLGNKDVVVCMVAASWQAIVPIGSQ